MSYYMHNSWIPISAFATTINMWSEPVLVKDNSSTTTRLDHNLVIMSFHLVKRNSRYNIFRTRVFSQANCVFRECGNRNNFCPAARPLVKFCFVCPLQHLVLSTRCGQPKLIEISTSVRIRVWIRFVYIYKINTDSTSVYSNEFTVHYPVYPVNSSEW